MRSTSEKFAQVGIVVVTVGVGCMQPKKQRSPQAFILSVLQPDSKEGQCHRSPSATAATERTIDALEVTTNKTNGAANGAASLGESDREI